jgi:PPOX class probable F420-dependent enzyme
VAGWPVARLATVRADGRPRVVPCCFAIDGDVLYSAVDGKPKRTARLGRLDDVRANLAVSLVVDEYAEDWTRLWWARLDGSASVVDEGAVWQRAIDLLRAKYAQYREHPPEGAVIVVQIEDWQTWSWSGPAHPSA